MSRPQPLTERQLRIVDQISYYYLFPKEARVGREQMTVRELIAEDLDLSTSQVRMAIDRLCQRYDCPTRDLPARVAAERVEA
jgi:hypothetical protein